MGIFDKAKDLLNEHNATVDQGIDKAANLIDEKTGGNTASRSTRRPSRQRTRSTTPAVTREAESPAPGPPAGTGRRPPLHSAG